jgi:hypothetical protein
MDYVKGILSGLAAIFAEFTFFSPVLRGSKATGLPVLKSLLVGSVLSFRQPKQLPRQGMSPTVFTVFGISGHNG